MRLGLLMAAYKRHGLLRLALKHNLAAARAAGLDVVPVCVVSPDDAPAYEIGRENDWEIVEADNRPLSAKWQAGLTRLREYHLDAVCIIGSDDFLSTSVYVHLSTAVEKGALLTGYLDHYLFRGIDQKCVRWPGYEGAREGDTIGTGRTYSRELLEAVDWSLWPEAMDRNLDGQARDRCRDLVDGLRRRTVALRLDLGREAIVDVKHDPENVGLGQFEQFPGMTVDTKETLALLGAETARALVELTDPLPRFIERSTPFARRGAAIPRIALVMIASRAETVALAARSAMPVIDEIVAVVDSRRTDAWDVLALLGARVTCRDWAGFASARNAAAEMTDAEWHVILDDDETLEPGDLLDAIKQAETEGSDAVLVTVAATTRPGFVVPSLQPRVLHRGKYRYAFKRHNDLVDDLHKPVVSSAIVHASYVGTMAAKIPPILVDLLEMYENPSDPAVPPEREKAHAAFHLARAYASSGDWANARTWAVRCRAIDSKQPRARHETVIAIECWATLLLDGLQTADWVVTDALRQFPDMAELHYLAVQIHAPLCYAYGVQAGRYASQPQGCIAWLPRFPQALAMLGIGCEITYKDEEPAEA